MSIGSEPNTGWLAGSGVPLGNGVECDEFCAVAPDIVAAGDVASWYHRGFRERIRLEHRTNANEQGAAAARTLLGNTVPFTPIPFFWTDQYDTKIQMYGSAASFTDADIVRGSVAGRRFAVEYRCGGVPTAYLTWNMPRAGIELRAKLTADLAGHV